MYYVTVTDSDESFTYLSAAICDSDSYHGVKNADHIVFGTHGPNIHNIPKYSNYDLSHASTVILSNPIKQWSEELADDVPYISAEDEFGFEINLDGIK